MLRISSRRFCADVAVTASLLLTSIAAFGQSTSGQSLSVQSLSGTSSGQSLGDVARANQEKKAADASGAMPPKVITNADLPKKPDEDADPVNQNQNSAANTANTSASRKAAQQRAAEQRAGEHWRQQILEQKDKIANLQARCDRLRARIHFADPGNPYSSGVGYYAGQAYNAQEAREMERLHDMEYQLSQQKQKLERMQEAARHAGMHTTVYDP
ncbi:MAG: hypothetical protein WAU58_20035 [Terriglobales bacterium]